MLIEAHDNYLLAVSPTAYRRLTRSTVGSFPTNSKAFGQQLSTLLNSSNPRSISTMPTPESQMFLAKKPKVPPTFDGVDYDDTAALKAAQDSVIREQWVKSMMARLIREELGKCYYREGVNHLEKCGHLRGELA